jgi:hypothetical protein
MSPQSHPRRTSVVKIETAFGSDVQQGVAMRVLEDFLTAWKNNVEASHEKNMVVITYDTKPERE